VIDNSGNGHNGVITTGGTTASGRFGNAKGSLTCWGDCRIAMTRDDFSFTDNMSIAFWVNPAAGQPFYATIFDKNANSHGPGYLGWCIQQPKCCESKGFMKEFRIKK
jgi:hypothetical protein